MWQKWGGIKDRFFYFLLFPRKPNLQLQVKLRARSKTCTPVCGIANIKHMLTPACFAAWLPAREGECFASDKMGGKSLRLQYVETFYFHLRYWFLKWWFPPHGSNLQVRINSSTQHPSAAFPIFLSPLQFIPPPHHQQHSCIILVASPLATSLSSPRLCLHPRENSRALWPTVLSFLRHRG